MRGALAFFCAVAALAVPARAATRSIVVVNGGNEAIFTLRVGHAADNGWGADVLGFGSTIDVSSGRQLSIDVDPLVCTYDLLATYGDGHTQMQTADLCTVDRVRFDH